MSDYGVWGRFGKNAAGRGGAIKLKIPILKFSVYQLQEFSKIMYQYNHIYHLSWVSLGLPPFALHH